MLGLWLGRVVGFGFVAGVLVACSTSTSDDGGGGDASVDAGSDASPNNRVTNDAGACISNCHEDDPCTSDAQCASGTCTEAKCSDPSCTDGKQDGTETASDCGGVCQGCADGLACVVGGDCASGVCDATTKTCAVPTDTDGVKNGNESGTDCGSSGTGVNTDAPPCGDGQGCTVPTDCADKQCGDNDTCTPASCSDGILNGTETAKDCGGLCNGCADGIACKVDADCVSKSCDTTATLLCLAPTATDGIQNGNETDTDCGSGGTNDNGENTHAPACNDGEKCVTGMDCMDLVCGTNGTCSAPSCKDGQINGGETDTDCGDGIITGCPACKDGDVCAAASDCTSLNCVGKKCAVPTDTDKIQNGNESDIDCGSSNTGENTNAPKCPDINATTKVISVCSAGADCKSGYCNTTEKKCVDGQSCAMPAAGSASIIHDIKTQAGTTVNGADATGTANVNGAGLYAGIDTCGQGEATDPASQRALESCCKSLDVNVAGEGNVRIDKYEVTSGRVRQFIEAVSAEEVLAKHGAYDIQQWVNDQISGNTAAGAILSAEIPTTQTGVTDVRQLYPAAQGGTLGLVEQLGGVSMDTGTPSYLQGCYVGVGNAGSSTYWWDSAGEAIVGSPPRDFTQDYYDIKGLNCSMYWMAAAFCAWDGGFLPSAAEQETLWGTGSYPWGSGSRNYQALGGLTAFEKWLTTHPTGTIEQYTVDNLNDYSGGNFYFYPNNSNPSTGNILDTIDDGDDFSPYIASPGRFLQDITALTATTGSVYGGDAWYDVAANLFEYRALSTLTGNSGIFCDTTQGELTPSTTPPGTSSSTSGCPTTDAYGTVGTVCSRADYTGKTYLCGFERGSGTTLPPVSKMPAVTWMGGSWEVHSIPGTAGGYGVQGSYLMDTQYGKAGFRCARAAE